MLKDPRAFWTAVSETSIAAILLVRDKMAKDLTAAFSFYMKHFIYLFTMQGRELTIHREIETGIRNESLSEAQLKECYSLLDGLRAEVQAHNAQVSKTVA